MIVSDFLDHLTLGELKQVSVGGFADYGTVQAQDTKELLQHINLGLLQLYARFPLRERELVLQTEENVEVYPLPAEHNLLRIQTIWLGNTEVPINDSRSEYSVFLPTFDTLQIPWATGEESLSIIYLAKPDKLVELTEEIPLPDSLIEALLSYVEFRVRKSMGGESHVALAMAARQQYESLVQAVEANNLLHTGDDSTCIKPALRGWV